MVLRSEASLFGFVGGFKERFIGSRRDMNVRRWIMERKNTKLS